MNLFNKKGSEILFNISSVLLFSISIILLNSCENSTNSASQINPENQKLEKRRSRWQTVRLCLRAMSSENGRVNELCSEVPDEYNLAQQIGAIHVMPIAANQLEILEQYEKDLNDGVISHLPPDRIGFISLFDFQLSEEDEKALADYKANYKPDL